MITLMLHRIAKHFYWLLPLMLFALLLARNPFSMRTQIPNLEPFPDTFHYITPVRCLLQGEGWTICREGRGIPPSVPPLYSFTLLPAILLYNDPRMFYFMNVGLSLIAFGLITVLLTRLGIYKSLRLFALTLFVSNYFVFWFPTLAMSENLLLPLVLLALNLLVMPVRWRTILLAAMVTPAFYLTKYAAAPLVVVFGLAFIAKILSGSVQLDTKYHSPSRFVLRTSVFIVIAAAMMLLFVGGQIFSSLISITSSLFPDATRAIGVNVNSGPSSFFSLQYWANHALSYMKAVFGSTITTLWHHKPLIPVWVGVGGAIGYTLELFVGKFRLLSGTAFAMIAAQIAFMATFSTVDGRYIIIVIPLMIIGFSLLLQHTHALASRLMVQRFFSIGIVAMTVVYLLVHALFFKQHIMLNLKYAETPWWYHSITMLKGKFEEVAITAKDRPVLITAIPPHLFDFYAPDTFELLPLSSEHDFQHHRRALFGIDPTVDLITLYTQYLEQGRVVYLTNYGIGNVPQRRSDFEQIIQNFSLELIHTDCHELCNVWRVGK